MSLDRYFNDLISKIIDDRTPTAEYISDYMVYTNFDNNLSLMISSRNFWTSLQVEFSFLSKYLQFEI